MTDCQYCEISPARRVDGSYFPQGLIEFPFTVGVPNVWYPGKSYFRVAMTLYGAPAAAVPTQPTVSQMVALADNAVCNLFDNFYMRHGNTTISSITQGFQQAGSLKKRLKGSYAWHKSMGAGAFADEAKFPARVLATASGTPPVPSLYSENEMYKPVAAGHFLDAEIDISAAAYNTVQVLDIDGKTTDTVVEDPIDFGGVVTGTNTAFTTGMPGGGAVVEGDILVVAGVPYSVLGVNSATELVVQSAPSIDVTNETDWYIVRKDVIRSSQASNTVYALWCPPAGIFDWDGGLGSGTFQLILNPNGNYLSAAVETRNPGYSASPDGTTGTYSLVVNDIKFYSYMEKMQIPNQVQDINLYEVMATSKPWSNNLQFTVPRTTTAITIFIQDPAANRDPQLPPSMFKMADNSDLALQQVQVTYANITKTATPWSSNFSPNANPGVNELQQRYHDSYEEAGVSPQDCPETYYDWLLRGPFYHFNFIRDANNQATEISVNTVFNSLPNGPSSANGAGLVWCVAHYRRAVQITTAAGQIVNSSEIAATLPMPPGLIEELPAEYEP